MSFNWLQVQNGLVQWVTTNSLFNAVIWRNQNEVQPKRPYIDLFIRDIHRPMNDIETLPILNGDRTLYGIRNFTLDVRLFGTWNALAQLDELLTTIQRRDSLAQLREHGITIVHCGDIIDTSSLEDSKFVERADAEILCRLYIEVPYGGTSAETSIIETVNIQGVLEPDLNLTSRSQSITLP
jgi:hypothetical protein